MNNKGGRTPAGVRFFPVLTAMLAILFGCSADNGVAPPAGMETAGSQENGAVPLVTLQHWKDSTPGERFSFLIGFVTMLELEKEWQGRDGGGLLPFERSLTGAWVRGFENRPLTEIYHGLNRYISDNPGDLDRPAAEVMWFLFAQPRMPAQRAGGNTTGSSPDSDASEGPK